VFGIVKICASFVDVIMSEAGDGKLHSTKSANLTPEQLQEYSNLIKQRAKIYREENTQMEEILKKLKLLNDELKLIGLSGSVESLDKSLSELEAKSLNLEKAELRHAEKLRKHSNYLSKLKICIRYYINLNESISEQVKTLKRTLQHSKQNVNGVLKLHPQDIQQLEEKAKKYENELLKFEKKYPWLKQPDYDLQNIRKYTNILNSLKEEKDNLLKELNVYQNLKPDIKEAKQQLANLKEEVKSAMISFNM